MNKILKKSHSTYILEWQKHNKQVNVIHFQAVVTIISKVRIGYFKLHRSLNLNKFINLIHAIQNLKEVYENMSVVNPNHVIKLRSHFT